MARLVVVALVLGLFACAYAAPGYSDGGDGIVFDGGGDGSASGADFGEFRRDDVQNGSHDSPDGISIVSYGTGGHRMNRSSSSSSASSASSSGSGSSASSASASASSSGSSSSAAAAAAAASSGR